MLRRDLLWALDPVRFAREALGFHPDSTQTRVLRSTKLRLLLNCTRQWGKSTNAAVLALHRALYYPKSLILLVSPSQRQSSELFRKVAAFLNQLAIKPAKLEDNQFSLQLAKGSRIVALPGKEATVRGFSGVTLIIEDEASRVDDFYLSDDAAHVGGERRAPHSHEYTVWEARPFFRRMDRGRKLLGADRM